MTEVPQKERPMIKVPGRTSTSQSESVILDAVFAKQKERPMFRALQEQREAQKILEKKVKAIINYHETCAKAAAKLMAELKKIHPKPPRS